MHPDTFPPAATAATAVTLHVGDDVWTIRALRGRLLFAGMEYPAELSPRSRTITITDRTSNETLGRVVAEAIDYSLTGNMPPVRPAEHMNAAGFYVCPVCAKAYKTPAGWGDHMRKAHRIEPMGGDVIDSGAGAGKGTANG